MSKKLWVLKVFAEPLSARNIFPVDIIDKDKDKDKDGEKIYIEKK